MNFMLLMSGKEATNFKPIVTQNTPKYKTTQSIKKKKLRMKLIYFNAMGRAELARLILAHAGADYEDCRIEKEQWPALKPSKLHFPLYIMVGVVYNKSVFL